MGLDKGAHLSVDVERLRRRGLPVSRLVERRAGKAERGKRDDERRVKYRRRNAFRRKLRAGAIRNLHFGHDQNSPFSRSHKPGSASWRWSCKWLVSALANRIRLVG